MVDSLVARLSLISVKFLLLLAVLVVIQPSASESAVYLHNFECKNCHAAGISLYSMGAGSLCLQCHDADGGPDTVDGRTGPQSSFSDNDMSNAMGTHSWGPSEQSSHNWNANRDYQPAAGATPATKALYLARYNASAGKLTCSKCHNPHAYYSGSSGPGLNTALRMDNTNDAVCLNCHTGWNKPFGNQGLESHPIGAYPDPADSATWPASWSGVWPAHLKQPTNMATFPEISDANVRQKLVDNGGQVTCTACHGTHFTDSEGSTVDGMGQTLEASDGSLLVTDGRSLYNDSDVLVDARDGNTLCQACHNYAVHGNDKVACLDCHSGHSYNASGDPNYKLLRSSVEHIETRKNGFMNLLTGLDYTTPDPDWRNGGGGYCEACHDMSSHSNGPAVGGEADCGSCHGHDASAGAFGGACNSCHGFAPNTTTRTGVTPETGPALIAPSSTVYSKFNEGTTVHISHSDPLTDTSANHNLACQACHATFPTNHTTDGTGTVDFGFGAVAKTGAATPAFNDTGSGSCSSVYCHSNGNDGAFDTVTWEGARGTISNCSACHGDTDATMTTASNTSSHNKHLVRFGNDCSVCHVSTASDNATLVRAGASSQITANHVNGTADVFFDTNYNLGVGTLGSTNDYSATTDCSAVYCHSDGTGAGTYVAADWAAGTGGACGDCHNLDVASGSAMATGKHGIHINDAANDNVGRDMTCFECHNATVTNAATPTLLAQTTSSKHVDGDKTVALNSESGGGCSSIKCHSNGNFDTGATITYNLPAWTGSTTLDCNDCHGNGTVPYPTYGNGGKADADANSHVAHITSGATCNDCHSETSTAGTSIDGTTPANHVNQNVDVVGAGIGGWNNTTKTCSTVTCHGGNDMVWGDPATLSCADCHLSTAADVDDFAWNGTTATIDSDEWTYSGHGLAAASTYEDTGRAGADFDAAATGASASACFYCHDSSVDHNQANYFRLRDNGLTDLNGNCLACHGTGNSGVDPDGSGSFDYSNKTSTIKIDKYHGGGQHTAATDGGRWCWDCHDPHGDASAANQRIQMIQRNAAVNPDAFGKPASLTATDVVFTDNTVGAGAGGFARDITGAGAAAGICNNCHTTTAQYTQTTGKGTHPTSKCTSCHEHSADTTYDQFAFAGSGCNGCHGGGYDSGGGNAWSENNYWPDDGNANAENDGGRHQKHMTDLASAKYGETLNELLTDTGNGTADAKQVFLCAYCHTSPGNDADHGDPVDLPAEVNSFYAIWDLTRSTADNGVYSAVADTCATADCHNNVTTTDNTFGWYDAGTSSCTMCHSVNPTTDTTHVAHTGASTNYGVTINCATCHQAATNWGTSTPPASGHRDGSWTITTGYAYSGSWSGGTKGGCGTASCHNNGLATPGAATRVETWGTPLANDCASCHLGSTMASNAHADHLGSNALSGANLTFNTTDDCIACHTGTTNGSGLASGGNHLNGSVNLAFASTYNYEGFTASRNNGGTANDPTDDTCSAVICHSGATTPTWDKSTPITCGDCHGNGSGPLPTGTIASDHGMHANNDATYTDCDNCHGGTTGLVSNNYTVAGGNANHQNLVANVVFNTDKVPGAGYSDANDGAGVNYNTADSNHADDGTCSSVECHFNNATPAWNAAASAYPDRCVVCHNDGAGAALKDSVPSATAAIHDTHVTTADADYVDDCASCHGAGANTAVHAGHGQLNGVDFVAGFDYDIANTGEANCTNACHLAADDGDWAAAGAIGCADCHGSGKALDAGGESDLSASIGPNAGEHDAHMGNTAILTSGCTDCHGHSGSLAAAGHVNGPTVNAIEVEGTNITDLDLVTGGAQLVTPGSWNGTCANACHSVTDGRDWTSATTLNCTDCHSSTLSLDGGGENDLSTTVGPTAGKHDIHTVADADYMGAATCTTCHGHSGALGDFAGTGHVDTAKDIDGTNVSVYNSGTGNCTNACHALTGLDKTASTSDDVAWLTADTDTLSCQDCHTTAKTLGAAGSGTMSATVAPATGKHTRHMANNTYVPNDCTDCHGHKGALNAGSNGHVNGPANTDITMANEISTYDAATTQTCTNSCHVVADGRDWTSVGTLNCADCHNASTKSLDQGGWPAASFSHSEHLGSNALPGTAANGEDCYACHDATVDNAGALKASGFSHADNSVALGFNAAFGYQAASAARDDKTTTADPSDDTCSAVECHNGAVTPAWGVGTAGTVGDIACGDCHGSGGGEPAPSGSTAGSHAKHIDGTANDYTDCAECHSGADSYTATGGTNHQDLTVQMTPHSGTYTDGDGGAGIVYTGDFTDDGTCATVDCHYGVETPAWGAAGSTTCTTCHNNGTDSGNLVDAYPDRGWHERHVVTADADYVNECAECHGANDGTHTGHGQVDGPDFAAAITTWDATNNTCTNSCHLAGNNDWIETSNQAAQLATGDLVCNDCHNATGKALQVGGSLDASTPPATGKHAVHAANSLTILNSGDCTVCHPHAGALGNSATTKHVNGAAVTDIDLDGTNITAPAATSATWDNTCTNKCHDAAVADDGWAAGALECADCHGGGDGTLTISPVGSGQHNAHNSGAFPAAYTTAAANDSTAGAYDYNCANCHGNTGTNHMNNAKTVTAGSWDGSTCSSNSCHGNGAGGAANLAANWSTGWVNELDSDKCNNCHGNLPTTGAHQQHAVGIHADTLYDGASGLMAAGTGNTNAHGNSTWSSTINCNVCHATTVTMARNMFGTTSTASTSCNTASCHSGDTQNATNVMAVADKSIHVDGTKDVDFTATAFKSKAQLRDDIETVNGVKDSWNRTDVDAGPVSDYKVAGAFDLQQPAALASNTGSSCSTIVCHNNGNATWSDTPGDCTKCHTGLPQ